MQRLPRQAPGQGEAGAGDLCSLPQSYATCALGIQFVGYVMICFGAVDALCSVLFGRLARHTGRIPLFALGRRVLGGAHPAGGWGEEGGSLEAQRVGGQGSGGRQGASQKEEISVHAPDAAGCLNTQTLLLALGDQGAADTR